MADISNLTNEYNKIMKELEKNISDTANLEFAKAKVSELFMVFLDKIDSIVSEYEEKLDNLVLRQKNIEEKVLQMESSLKGIEKDIYEEGGYDFEIVCPYCNNEFVIEFNESNNEIECPECKNIIELDWDGGSSDCEEHHGCGNGCCGHHHAELEEQVEDDEDEDL